MANNPYEQASIDKYVPFVQQKFLEPCRYYNSLVKPSIRKINKSVSALKPMVYAKPADPEVLNALYLRPKVITGAIKDELYESKRAQKLENMSESKVMSARKKEVKF